MTIDTDKYEGHTPAIGWRKADGSAMSMQTANNDADAELMADAPLLLAEVKRLREGIERIAKVQSIALHIEKDLLELIE